MKRYLKIAAVVALLFTLGFLPARSARAEEKSKRPGVKEQAEVDKANKVLDDVYRDLTSKAENSADRSGSLDADREKTSLREPQRAWIKWRDAEAMYIARHGGAVGGGALRMDYLDAQLKLINDHIAVLKAYASQAPAD